VLHTYRHIDRATVIAEGQVGEGWRLSNKSTLPVTGEHSENKVLFVLLQNKINDERTQPEQRHSHYLLLSPYNTRSASNLLPVIPVCL